ncbi:UNVERIFIED_CONTAM: Tetratricopeptide repeat protein 16 [Siphonaria sp. JEL0065]|nr:Tetratricopeptide repeat protein 16 [Siphonaria sp. JEL0065]
MKKAQMMMPPLKSRAGNLMKPEPNACWRGVMTGSTDEEDEEAADLFYTEKKFEACASSSAWFNIRLRRIYYTFGQILLDQRRLHESLKYFKLSRDFGMCPSSVYLRMAAIYIGLHKTDEALELLYNLIEKHPTQADLYILRAKLYSELGHVDLVSMDLNKVISYAPQHPEMKQLMEYVIWTSIKYKNKASAQILKGQFDVAVFFLNHALELDPTDWITLLKRGVIFSELGHYESAIADLMTVLEMDERDKERDMEVKSYVASVYNKLGVDHYLNENYEDAIKIFTKALRFSSTEGIIYKNLADCYLATNEEAKREQCLCRAFHLDPNDDESRERLAHLYFQRGENAVFAGHYPYGLIELSKAIELNPSAPEYSFERGRTHVLTEQMDLAREDLATVVRLDPTHRDAAAMLDQLTRGIPADALKPFPPQKKVQKGPFETTGNPRKTLDCKVPLEVNTQARKLVE